MRTGRPLGLASLFLVAGMGLAGCQTVASGTEGQALAPPASVEDAADGGPSRLSLTEEAVVRLGVDTAPVESGGDGGTVPYAAVVYDADGAAWVFVEVEPGVYQRAPITITGIDGDRVAISDGPAAGTQVVTVAAAELVGVEAGISGGE